MSQEIKTIVLSAFMTSVNCYLVKTGENKFVLIDTGMPNDRSKLEKELVETGCRPGDLQAILITHGDIDHLGNAAYLHEKFGGKIGMHLLDSPSAESGNMLAGRKSRTFFSRILFSLMKLGRKDRFKPDLDLADGVDLSPYGLDARVVHTPGHSMGSISILTGAGDLFCGDLLTSTGGPKLNTLIDDLAAAKASLANLQNMHVAAVYPGHGKAFRLDQLQE